jgi:hypothetical protein
VRTPLARVRRLSLVQQAHVHRIPFDERPRAEQAGGEPTAVMPTDAEEILHDAVNRGEALQLGGRPHLPLTLCVV